MPLFVLGDGGNTRFKSFPKPVDRVTPVPIRTVPARPSQSQPVPAHPQILEYRTKYAPVPSQPFPAPL